MNNVEIRRAEKKDIDFIIETIIEAEKSFTNVISYCTIFSLTEEEVVDLFRKFLNENIPGQEFCYSDYLVAVDGEEYLGACASWVEGTEGFSSSVIKADLLLEFLSYEKMAESKHLFEHLQKINIEREINSLQIVNAYVRPQHRGKGIISRLINEHIKIQKAAYPFIKKAQLRPTGVNEAAYKAYNKMGFEFVREQKIEEDFILNYLPAKSKILMEKVIE